MSDPKATDSIIRFQRFELDLQSGDLRKDGTRFKLQNQPFRVLAALLERPGQGVGQVGLPGILRNRLLEYGDGLVIVQVVEVGESRVDQRLLPAQRRGYECQEQGKLQHLLLYYGGQTWRRHSCPMPLSFPTNGNSAEIVGQVGNLRRVVNPPDPLVNRPAGAGCQPARRIPSCPTIFAVFADSQN